MLFYEDGSEHTKSFGGRSDPEIVPFQQLLRVRYAQRSVDIDGCAGLVEGVEVDALDVVVEQVAALFGGPVDTDAADGVVRAIGAAEGAEHGGGVAHALCEFGHAAHAGH